MNHLDHMPEYTEHVLGGLRADEKLKFRIYQKASDISANPMNKRSRIAVPVLCGISVAMIGAFLLLGSIKPVSSSGPVDIQTIPAGKIMDFSPIQLQNIIDETVNNYENEASTDDYEEPAADMDD